MPVCRLSEVALLGLIMALWVGATSALAGEPEAGIQTIVESLDDESFAVRDAADRKLLEIGKPALAALRKAARSDSPEKRVRATKLVRRIREGIIRAEFEKMGKMDDEDLEVEHALWAVSLFLDPELEKKEVTTTLDEIADAVREKLGKEKVPGSLPPAEAMTGLISVLKEQYGLVGDTTTYQNPDNSSIHRVIARRKGLPILLSEIAVAVARRLELPVVGLGIPGRYMIKYEGRRAPAGQPREDIIINPFEGWQEIGVRDLVFSVPGFDADEHLQQSPARLTILRIMRNMENHAGVKEKQELVSIIRECYQLVAGGRFPLFR